MHDLALLAKANRRDTPSIGCSYKIRVVTRQDVCKGFLIQFEKKNRMGKRVLKYAATSAPTTLFNRTRRLWSIRNPPTPLRWCFCCCCCFDASRWSWLRWGEGARRGIFNDGGISTRRDKLFKWRQLSSLKENWHAKIYPFEEKRAFDLNRAAIATYSGLPNTLQLRQQQQDRQQNRPPNPLCLSTQRDATTISNNPSQLILRPTDTSKVYINYVGLPSIALGATHSCLCPSVRPHTKQIDERWSQDNGLAYQPQKISHQPILKKRVIYTGRTATGSALSSRMEMA